MRYSDQTHPWSVRNAIFFRLHLHITSLSPNHNIYIFRSEARISFRDHLPLLLGVFRAEKLSLWKPFYKSFWKCGHPVISWGWLGAAKHQFQGGSRALNLVVAHGGRQEPVAVLINECPVYFFHLLGGRFGGACPRRSGATVTVTGPNSGLVLTSCNLFRDGKQFL